MNQERDPEKRVRESPSKSDYCMKCLTGLDESAKCLQCDSCSKRTCATCLKLNDEEFAALNSTTSKLECAWNCSKCLASPSTHASSVADITSAVLAAMLPFQTTITQALAELVNSTMDTLKADFERLNTKMATIEQDLFTKCDEKTTRSIAREENKSATVSALFASNIIRIVRAEKNHDSQKLNIVAFGIPVSGDPSIFIRDHLMHCSIVSILASKLMLDVCRLV